MGRKFSEYTITEKIEMKNGGYEWWPCQAHNGYWASCIGCPECKDEWAKVNSFSFGRVTKPDAAIFTKIEFNDDFTEMGDSLVHNSLLEVTAEQLCDCGECWDCKCTMYPDNTWDL